MKRYNRKVNSYFRQYMPLQQLVPLGFHEIVPGQSVQGEVNCTLLSVPTNGALQNDIHLDIYGFYCPYRLVWDLWPNFVSQKPTGTDEGDPTVPATVPLITDTDPRGLTSVAARYFCKQFLKVTDSVAGEYSVSALPFSVYAHIWNSFFRPQWEDPLDLPVTAITSFAQARMSISDFHAKVLDIETDLDQYAIGTTTDDLRQAMASESWNRVRNTYGNKYTDYLRSLGVNANLALQEEPEVCLKHSGKLQYTLSVNSALTATENLGEKAGYYRGIYQVHMARKHFAEHGLLYFVGVIRPERSVSAASHPAYARGLVDAQDADVWMPSYQQFWSPEAAEVSRMKYPAALLQRNAVAALAPNDPESKPWIDLTSPVHLDILPINHTNAATPPSYWFAQDTIADTVTADNRREDYLQPISSTDLGAMFLEDLNSGAFVAEIAAITSKFNFEISSPISNQPSLL